MAQFHSMLTITSILFFTIIMQTSVARTLPPPPSHHLPPPSIAFLDVLTTTLTHPPPPAAAAAAPINGHQLPFSQPLLDLLPPITGIPLPKPNPTPETIIMAFPAARAALQELEFEAVTTINEDLLKEAVLGLQQLLGKARGILLRA